MFRILFALLFGLTANVALAVSHFDLEVMNGDGGRYKSAEKGSAFLLEFYFDSCPACNTNAPNVKEVAEEFHSDRVQVLEVGIDCSASQYANWVRKHNPFVPVLNDCDRDVTGELGVRSFPTTVIVDCNMQEVKRYVGVWNARTKQEIKDKLLELQFQTCD